MIVTVMKHLNQDAQMTAVQQKQPKKQKSQRNKKMTVLEQLDYHPPPQTILDNKELKEEEVKVAQVLNRFIHHAKPRNRTMGQIPHLKRKSPPI